MVGVGPGGVQSQLGRVTVVNVHGNIIYDTFVQPVEEVTDYRTRWSGIRPHDLKNGKDFFVVQKEVADIIKDRIVIGHDLDHDFKV